MLVEIITNSTSKRTISAAVLVDQIDIGDRSATLNRHLLQLIDDILERTASNKRAVGRNDIGVGPSRLVDDRLMCELVDLGVECNGCGLLEGDVVRDAGARVHKVGHHRCVGHPV
jgi:hypothetical protein